MTNWIKMFTAKRVDVRDCLQLWEWANDEQVMLTRLKFDPKKPFILLTDHIEWFFEQLQKDEEDLVFFIIEKDGVPIGQARFDLIGDIENNRKNPEVVISVSIDKAHRGLGYGADFIKFSCREFMKTVPKCDNIRCQQNNKVKIVGYIKPFNVASIRSFEKANFKNCEEIELEGQKMIRMVKNIL